MKANPCKDSMRFGNSSFHTGADPNAEEKECTESSSDNESASQTAASSNLNRDQLDSLQTTKPRTLDLSQEGPSLSFTKGADPNKKVRRKTCICSYCNKAFRRNCELQDHVRSHTGEKPFTCHVCQSAFGNRRSLNTHVKKHTPSEDIVCSICSESFTEAELPEHLKMHTWDVVHESDNGRNATDQKDGGGEKAFASKICSESFSRKDELKTRIATHPDSKPFACSVCDAAYVNVKQLNHHMRKHDPKNVFSCEKCSKKFRSMLKLARHVSVHTGERPYVCETCGKSFAYNNNLKTHIKVHVEGLKKPFKCEICSKAYRTRQYLEDHIRTHTGEKPFTCDICKGLFGTKRTLLAHVVRRHTGAKKWACEICSKHFLTGFELNLHLRVHTGEKPFECEQCGYRCTQRYQLKCHIKTHDKRATVERKPSRKFVRRKRALRHSSSKSNTGIPVNDAIENSGANTHVVANVNTHNISNNVVNANNSLEPLVHPVNTGAGTHLIAPHIAQQPVFIVITPP